MSANSGIVASPELQAAFGDAVTSQAVRFLIISIKNESLVPEESIPPSGTLDEDLDKLSGLLEDDVPAYVLVRLDDPPTDWLAVFYVPDVAKVRDKMLYASTRSSLTKAFGATAFTDTIFATSKDDINASGYAKHRASLAAPKPMSAREKEMEEIKAAELRATEGGSGYQGSRARVNHIGTQTGLKWSEEVEQEIKNLFTTGDESVEGKLIVMTVDPSEIVVLSSVFETNVNELGSKLPPSDPAYGFFVWPHNSRRHVVFIYSCPSSSPVKHRMLYSSGVNGIFHSTKMLLQDIESPTASLISRKLETSDPTEVNEHFLMERIGDFLNLEAGGSMPASGAATPSGEPEKLKFAKPRGPARRAR